MKCRRNISGKKIWDDMDNLFDTRPQSVEIVLYRDGEPIDSVVLDSQGDGIYRFDCLPKWRDRKQTYLYAIDEPNVPTGYIKKIIGFNVNNILESIAISGIKIWEDSFNQSGKRPSSINLHLYQNGILVRSIEVPSPIDSQQSIEFYFGEFPYADENGVAFDYTVAEDAIPDYSSTIVGLSITNSLIIVP